jgi:uncharacterized protein YlxW (UPF0749 family)
LPYTPQAGKLDLSKLEIILGMNMTTLFAVVACVLSVVSLAFSVQAWRLGQENGNNSKQTSIQQQLRQLESEFATLNSRAEQQQGDAIPTTDNNTASC